MIMVKVIKVDELSLQMESFYIELTGTQTN